MRAKFRSDLKGALWAPPPPPAPTRMKLKIAQYTAIGLKYILYPWSSLPVSDRNPSILHDIISRVEQVTIASQNGENEKKKKETNKLSESFENGISEADALNQARMETPVAYFVNYIPDS